MNHPNNDVMIEILSCLPLKSLARLKTLNKTWYDIINSREFARRHREKSMLKEGKPWGLLVQQTDVDKGCLSISSSTHHLGFFFPVEGGFGELIRRYFKHSTPRIVGPLDGLICIYEAVPQFPRKTTIALCNPYLGGKVEMIPPPPLSSVPSFSGETSCNLGFGYDYVTGDYKIVVVFSSNWYGRKHIVWVYTRAKNSWKELDCNVLSGKVSIVTSFAPYQDGSFAHWDAREMQQGLYDRVVLSFDMGNEVFNATPLPPCFAGFQGYRLGIGIHSKEHSLALHHFQKMKSDPTECFIIDRWELGEGGVWNPTPLIEVKTPISGNLLGNNHGLIAHSEPTVTVTLTYLSPQETFRSLIIPKCYYNGQIEQIYLYEPSLIELKDDPINKPFGWVRWTVAAVAVAVVIGVVARHRP